MERSLKAIEELRQEYCQVTYDLAIAKIAYQIQSNEKERFRRLFVHLGPFHTDLALFKGTGKFVDDCGLTSIMSNADMLAPGSVNGFVTGKHYNRCKRLHPIMSLAVEIMHFRSFLKTKPDFEADEIQNCLQNFTKIPSECPKFEDEILIKFFEEYEDYKKRTLEGHHGKTQQFYLMYTKLINLYLMHQNSIRTGDFELLKHVLPEIAALFFTFNQPNYARYLIKYHDNLIKVEHTHPGLIEDFRKGIGIRRTDKNFSMQPIDLTVEQTINADAANKLKGKLYNIIL